MKEAHKTLWLQWEGDGEGEVTWCQDAINEDDIEYVRADIVQAQLAALAWARWVSVDERLPEDGTYIISGIHPLTQKYYRRLAFYRGGDWIDVFKDEIETISHWMQLPPAPQEK